MATITAQYRKSYKDIMAAGTRLFMVPDKVHNMQLAMLTTMFNFILMKNPGRLAFDVTEYSDGHKEYAYRETSGFNVRVIHP